MSDAVSGRKPVMAEGTLFVAAGVRVMKGECGGQASPSSEGVGGRHTAEEVLADLAWVALQHLHLHWIELPVVSASQEIGKTCGWERKG